jgi:predicted dehydrogenase
VSSNVKTGAPLKVGLVGAGPWAQFVHGPMFANHPGVALSGVWARNNNAAEALATELGTQAFSDFDEFLDSCEAVSFAVPPYVQVELAARAATAGKALLLEKPIALDLDSAQRLVDAIDEAGVNSQVLFTARYARHFRAFLDDVKTMKPLGGQGRFVLGSGLGGPYATPWRLDYGCLFDLGPHLLDALDAALGPIVNVHARGDSRRWIGLLLEHESGVVSDGSLSIMSQLDPFRAGVEIYDESGICEVDMSGPPSAETLTTLVDEFIQTARGTPHPIDVHRGLYIQRLLMKVSDELKVALA